MCPVVCLPGCMFVVCCVPLSVCSPDRLSVCLSFSSGSCFRQFGCLHVFVFLVLCVLWDCFLVCVSLLSTLHFPISLKPSLIYPTQNLFSIDVYVFIYLNSADLVDVDLLEYVFPYCQLVAMPL